MMVMIVTVGCPSPFFRAGSYTLEDIQAAAKAANVHSFIMELPDQYDTKVSKKGGGGKGKEEDGQ